MVFKQGANIYGWKKNKFFLLIYFEKNFHLHLLLSWETTNAYLSRNLKQQTKEQGRNKPYLIPGRSLNRAVEVDRDTSIGASKEIKV